MNLDSPIAQISGFNIVKFSDAKLYYFEFDVDFLDPAYNRIVGLFGVRELGAGHHEIVKPGTLNSIAPNGSAEIYALRIDERFLETGGTSIGFLTAPPAIPEALYASKNVDVRRVKTGSRWETRICTSFSPASNPAARRATQGSYAVKTSVRGIEGSNTVVYSVPRSGAECKTWRVKESSYAGKLQSEVFFRVNDPDVRASIEILTWDQATGLWSSPY